MTTSTTSVHGVFINVFSTGVLLTGESGIGKSELALALVWKGHQLIADDVVELKLETDNKVWGHCNPSLQDLVEVRGLGILNLRDLYGTHAIGEPCPLDFIINLKTFSNLELASVDRVNGIYRDYEICAQKFPEVTIPVVAGRNMVVLVETAVRKHNLHTDKFQSIVNRHGLVNVTNDLFNEVKV